MKLKLNNYTYFDGNGSFPSSDIKNVITDWEQLSNSRYVDTQPTYKKQSFLQDNVNTNNTNKTNVVTQQNLNNVETNKYGFNEDIFNQLIVERRYLDAADYAEQYHFDDPKLQKEHENDIINLRRNGRILAAIYSRIDNDDDLKKIEFYDAVFVNGGLERLNTTDPSKDTYNKYAAEFIKLKNNFGAEITDDGWTTKILENGKKANIIEYTFSPEKRKYFGIDFLAKDNTNTIEKFYNITNLSENDLKNSGVNVVHKDGETIISFDKSNELANKIIYTISKNFGNEGVISGGDVMVGPAFYENDKNILFGYHTDREMRNIIDDAKNTKDFYFQKLDITNKGYSSTVAPWISDDLQQLKNLGLSEDEYNKRAKLIAPVIFNALNSIGSGNYEMYSNYNNDENTDERLNEVDNIGRAVLAGLISGTTPSNMQVDAMIANGKIGALVTIGEKRNKDDELVQKRIQIFIPGLLQEQAQERINNDASTRAIQEINSMIDWGYDYKLEDGSSISVTPNGTFMKGDEEISREDAIRNIHKDIIITEDISNLKFNFMNSDGKLINADEYEKNARFNSLRAAYKLYPGAVMSADSTGEKYIINGEKFSADDIFNVKIDKNNIQYETSEIIKDIYKIYLKYMYDIVNYKQ